MTPLPTTAVDRLLLDAPADLTPVSAPRAVEEHRRHRASWYAPLVDDLVLTDPVLAAAARRAGGGSELAVTVFVLGGAGGLVALARRQLPGLRVRAVETALQDLDDLGGSAARVVAAAQQLEEVEVYVGLPPSAGWLRAVELVEAAGLCAAVTAGSEPGSTLALAEQLSVLVEADLPFLVRPRLDAARAAGRDPALMAMALLRAVAALVEGGSPADTAELLEVRSADETVAGVQAWDESTATRVRRRLRRAVLPVATTVAGLGHLRLVTAPRQA